jgi:predicted phosphoadenosine phosphosulfate sulfurtransferase
MTIYKKQFTDVSVYDAAVARINHLYDRFDTIAVSFSGGKDSTACLNLCLQVARERKRFPLHVHFWDEEAIYPPTVDYMRRVAAMKEVELKWFCLPIKHRNACSRQEPWWYPWDPKKKDLWVRPLPKEAITELAGFERGYSMPQVAHLAYGKEYGMVADVMGIRADESLRRYRSVMMKAKDNWVGGPRMGNNSPCKPIYDWSTVDVWLAPNLYGWDYNRAYDVLDKAGVPPHWQRVCPPFGEEPLGGLWTYSVCWPEIWHKMMARCHGVATAARYARTELYGFGKLELPRGQTWRSWTFAQLDLYPEPYKSDVARAIRSVIGLHKSKTRRPIQEDVPDAATGISWRYLAMLVNRGDMKGRRAGNASSGASNRRDREGIDLDDVFDSATEVETRY